MVDSLESANVSRANQVAGQGGQAFPQPVPAPLIAEENLPLALQENDRDGDEETDDDDEGPSYSPQSPEPRPGPSSPAFYDASHEEAVRILDGNAVGEEYTPSSSPEPDVDIEVIDVTGNNEDNDDMPNLE